MVPTKSIFYIGWVELLSSLSDKAGWDTRLIPWSRTSRILLQKLSKILCELTSTMTSNFDTHNPIRPSFSILIFFRPLLPFVEKIGTPAFRSWIVDHFPSERLRLIKNISDTIHSESIEILRDKRTAIQSGDQAMIDKVGEGKDIMSILCESSSFVATFVH